MLEARTPLGGYDETIHGIRIREIDGQSIISLAVPNGAQKPFLTAVKRSIDLPLPSPGSFQQAGKNSKLLLWTSPDQYFLISPEAPAYTVEALKKKLKNNAYLTDQSDSWVIVEVSGNGVLDALERICPINLHKGAFKRGMAARTHMEHLGVFILKLDEDRFWLLSARSSARSFLHSIVQSAGNI